MLFKEKLMDRIHLYDGSKGFLIMQKGLEPGDCPDAWNLSHPDEVYEIHKAYVDAGSDIIQTNTLQCSRYHLEARGMYDKLTELNKTGVALAKKAAGGKVLTAASVSPLGMIMAPYGELSYDEAYAAFSEQIKALLEAEVDILHFETFTDLSELRIGVLAAKELYRQAPVIATLSLDNGGRTVMGDEVGCSAATLAALGVDCAGANCGLSPRDLLLRFPPFTAFNAPLCSKPNAGIPAVENGVMNYAATEEEFYDTAFGFARLGARLIGGCCGSGPAHIRMLKNAVDAMNADRAYDYLNVFGNVTKTNGNIEICSHARKAVFSLERFTAYAEEIMKISKAKTDSNANKPGFYESADGKLLTVDLSYLFNDIGASKKFGKETLSEITADILSEAGESDAEATVFRAVACAGGREKRRETDNPVQNDIETVFKLLSENARAYHNKPVIFYTDVASALREAVKRYCGVPGVIVKSGAEVDAREALNGLAQTIIGV